jgi:hypothetical protein
MRTTLVVVDEPSASPRFEFGGRLVGPQVNALILAGSPEPLDETVVQSAATPVHAHCSPGIQNLFDECLGSELGILVRIDYLLRLLSGTQRHVERIEFIGVLRDTQKRVQAAGGDPERK